MFLTLNVNVAWVWSLEVEKQTKLREGGKSEIKEQGTLATWQQVRTQEGRHLMRKPLS